MNGDVIFIYVCVCVVWIFIAKNIGILDVSWADDAGAFFQFWIVFVMLTGLCIALGAYMPINK